MLVGDQVPRGAHARATARCSSASRASCSITPFFYSQSLLAALAALPAVLLVGVALDVLARPRPRGRAAVRAARGAAAQRRDDRCRACRSPRCCSCCSRASPRRCGDCRPTPARRPACPTRCRRADQRAVAVGRGRVSRRVRRRRRRRRRIATGAARCSRASTARDVVAAAGWPVGGRSTRRADAPITYTVTLEPTNRPLAVRARPAGGAADARARAPTRGRRSTCRASRATSSCSSRAPVDAGAALHAALGAARPPTRPTSADGRARQPAACRRRQSAHARSSRASCARSTPDDRALHRARCSRKFSDEAVRLHAGAAAATSAIRSTSSCSTTRRGFCEHYASAFVLLLRAAGIPGARGHRLPGRRDQSARRLHDRAPVGCARVGRSAARRPMAALRSDRGGRAVAHRDRAWRRAAGRRAAAVPRAPRRDVAQATCSSRGTRSTTTGGATSSASTATASARCGAMEARPARAVAGRGARRAVRWSRGALLVVGWLMWKRRRQERALVLWDDLNRRLARAGLPRHAARRSARVRRARGGALAAVRDRVRGDRRVVRGAALRRGRRREHATRGRALVAPSTCCRARDRQCCRRHLRERVRHGEA